MQILVEIDDKFRDKVQKELHKDIWNMQIMKYVNELTVLPKGHGRLIDADDFFQMFEELDMEPYNDAPTIIEADRGE